jgi:hypothetical protein
LESDLPQRAEACLELDSCLGVEDAVGAHDHRLEVRLHLEAKRCPQVTENVMRSGAVLRFLA